MQLKKLNFTCNKKDEKDAILKVNANFSSLLYCNICLFYHVFCKMQIFHLYYIVIFAFFIMSFVRYFKIFLIFLSPSSCGVRFTL